MKKNYLLWLFALILLFSCAKDESKNVNQDSIYTIYDLFYSQSNDKTTAQATFRFGGAGGTLLMLNEPASATFNGDRLMYNSVTGVHKKEYSGMIDSGTFIYTDLDNNVFTNSTNAIEIIGFPAVDTISSAGAFTFQWVGKPVQANETISLTTVPAIRLSG